MDFVGSPDILATFIELQIPTHPSSLIPKSKQNYCFEHKMQNKTHLHFPPQKSLKYNLHNTF